MVNSMYFKTSGRVRWNGLRARFRCDGPASWSRSVAICAREIIRILEKEGSVDGSSGRDDLLLALDAVVVRRVQMYGRSPAKRGPRPERSPFPAPDVLFRRIAPWWDLATGGRDGVPYRHVDEAFSDGKAVRERLIADGRTEDACALYYEMLARLLVDAFERICLELYGGDIIAAYKTAFPDSRLPEVCG